MGSSYSSLETSHSLLAYKMALSMAATTTNIAGLKRTANVQSQSRRAMTVVARQTTSSRSETPMTTTDYVKTLPGISGPFPDVFDPANFIAGASISDMRRYREAELTHGRVSMLAALGFVIGEQLEDFPLFYNFDSRISGPAINHFQQVGAGFWEPLVLAIGVCESYRVAVGWAPPTGAGFNSLNEDYVMGDLNFDPLNLLEGKSEAEIFELQTKELNNGRLAMIAIAGFVTQEFVNNTEIFEHLFRYIELEVIDELDDIEKVLNLPLTPLPEIVSKELSGDFPLSVKKELGL